MYEFNRIEECMGTIFRFHGRSPFDALKTVELLVKACEILHEADRTFSLYKPQSPLSRLARGEAAIRDLPPVVSEIWDACELWEKATDGWFSAMSPENTFDPSGIVKTWAAKRAAEYLEENGILDFTLNAGGDVWIGDAVSTEVDWRVGVHKAVSLAHERAGYLTVIDLRGTPYRGVATSGSAERGLHIWNPKAPGRKAAATIAQVTVVGRDLVEADVWATACFAEGERAIEHLNAHNSAHPENDFQALIIKLDEDLMATDGFIELFAKN
jgi:thiamine biosynthesis lipoprotein